MISVSNAFNFQQYWTRSQNVQYWPAFDPRKTEGRKNSPNAGSGSRLNTMEIFLFINLNSGFFFFLSISPIKTSLCTGSWVICVLYVAMSNSIFKCGMDRWPGPAGLWGAGDWLCCRVAGATSDGSGGPKWSPGLWVEGRESGQVSLRPCH